MTILILPSARDDFAEGFDFYERQQLRLGEYFLQSLFSDIESLRLYAGIHAKRFGLHRLLFKRFPYAIFYDQGRDTVRGVGCFELSARPGGNPEEARRASLAMSGQWDASFSSALLSQDRIDNGQNRGFERTRETRPSVDDL